MSIIALLLAIVTFVFSGTITWLGILLGLAACVLAYLDFSKKKHRALAIIAIVLGVLCVVAAVSAMMGNPLIHDIINVEVHNV